MMSLFNFDDLLSGPIYAVLANETTFVLEDESVVVLNAIDKSGGVEISVDYERSRKSSQLITGSIRPACVVRSTDIETLELAPEDFNGAILSLNGVSYRVESYYPKPSPNGEGDGELYFILQEAP